MKIPLTKPFRAADVVAVLGSAVKHRLGSGDNIVRAFAELSEKDGSGTLMFCSGYDESARRDVAASTAAVIICRPEVVAEMSSYLGDATLIAVDNPRLAFIRAIRALNEMPGQKGGVAGSAAIAASAVVGPGVTIGEMAVVSENCEIGEETRIDAGVILYPGTGIGRRCAVMAGAVIGTPGYGFERDELDRLHRFPHFGRVVIEDEVEIGSRASINCAALGETRIGRGTKIDDGAYVAHSVVIGSDCLIMAQAIICGSCVVDDNVEISPGAVIRDKVRIGRRAKVGLGAVVTRDVPADAVVAGVPARSLAPGSSSNA
jgi:UDP-3-O-[3-hydroxymyristoyl] glucosamine N-acyltransferase